MILEDGGMPVYDVLTTQHTSEWLHCLLLMFNAAVRRVNHGTLVTPRHVVTDFSYAFTAACVAAFNGGMQLDAYLEMTYDIVTRQMTTQQILRNTYLALCVAHMIKAMSVKLKAVENRSNVQKLTLTYFAALQRLASPNDASVLFLLNFSDSCKKKIHDFVLFESNVVTCLRHLILPHIGA